jgi:murein L,D-transpeptidase YafK
LTAKFVQAINPSIMRNLFVILILFHFSCHPSAQESVKSYASFESESSPDMKIAQKDSFDKVKVEKISDISKGVNERTVTFIKQRLQMLVGNFLQETCVEKGIHYPPRFIMFRFFKHEGEFEVWAGNSQTDKLHRIILLPACAVDKSPGTKLQEGDGKTPEGYYSASLYYGSTADFMWIKLNNSELDNYGKVGYGSSFKMCLDYPNIIDKDRTRQLLRGKSPGSAICIHGNCVSIGCISFHNKDYLPVFLAAMSHQQENWGKIQIHIFPFRFDKISSRQKSEFASRVKGMKNEHVMETWSNLEEGFKLFNSSPKALKVEISGNKIYRYESY